ncbi:hypothetical protein XENOCAPTIV_003409 [Xenoophorus captivus]|uniref:Uncharacterized protein n=1 Tax=Xenoophorus captivus TaxID=1517983 RepID=A0ABV0RWM7_9TELE
MQNSLSFKLFTQTEAPFKPGKYSIEIQTVLRFSRTCMNSDRLKNPFLLLPVWATLFFIFFLFCFFPSFFIYRPSFFAPLSFKHEHNPLQLVSCSTSSLLSTFKAHIACDWCAL